MLQKALSLFQNAKTAYLTARENNPLILSGDYDVKLSLHRKDSPEESANAAADGKISVAMVDIGLVCGLFLVLTFLGATFSLAGYIIKKIFD